MANFTPATRELGTTGLRVTELALGTAPLASFFWGNTHEAGVATALAAIDAGVGWFDTAPLYGLGESEQRLGEALAARPTADVVVATKAGRTLVGEGDGRDAVFDFSRDATLRQVDASLTRLGRDRVDVVHVHDPEEHLDQAIGECAAALTDLRDQGVISAVSVGTNHASTALAFLERAGVDVVMVAGQLTLLDRTVLGELLPACRGRGVPLLAAGVFNSGVLARPVEGAWFHYAPVPADVLERVHRFEAVCREAGVPLNAAALRFPLRFEGVASVVVGMASPAEVDANVTALATPIGDDVWHALDAI